MIKKIFVPAALSICILIGNTVFTEEAAQPEKVVTENMVITEVAADHLKGEPVTEKGEGVFLTSEELKALTADLSKMKPGQTIAVSWPEESYINEEWSNLYSVDLIDRVELEYTVIEGAAK